MPNHRKVLNEDELIELYLSGMSMLELAEKYGTCDSPIRRVLVEHGVTLRTKAESSASRWRRDKSKPPTDLASRYLGGESLKSLADHYGFARGGVHANGRSFGMTRMLIEAGVPIRGRSEAESLKWAAMPPERKARQMLAAHRAACSPAEYDVIAALAAIGQAVTHQFAVGKYHADIALNGYPVTVELQRIWSLQELAAGYKSRLEFFLNSGYAVVYVVGKLTRPDTVAQKVIAFAECVRRDESLIGRYGMIRGDGEPCAEPCPEFDPLPFVPRAGD